MVKGNDCLRPSVGNLKLRPRLNDCLDTKRPSRSYRGINPLRKPTPTPPSPDSDIRRIRPHIPCQNIIPIPILLPHQRQRARLRLPKYTRQPVPLQMFVPDPAQRHFPRLPRLFVQQAEEVRIQSYALGLVPQPARRVLEALADEGGLE